MMSTTLLDTNDLANVTTAKLTIDRLLAGFGDADMHRAAALLQEVIDHHEANQADLDAVSDEDIAFAMENFVNDWKYDRIGRREDPDDAPKEVEEKTFIHIPVEGKPWAFQCSGYELKTLQEHVGGYVEVAPNRRGVMDGHIMLVNEEGLLKQLPFNHNASVLSGYPLVGEAVIVGEAGEEWGSVSQDMLIRVLPTR